MDDNFRARVDKIFGSLAFSPTPPSPSPSPSPLPQSNLWSLTDDEVEKRGWNRHKECSFDRDQTPCSSSFDEIPKKRRHSRKLVDEDVDDPDGDEDVDDQMRVERDIDGDEWEIRASIGLDCTLDNEEEEDEFDKVAVGTENAGDRLYMSDVTDQGPYLNFHTGLSNSLREAAKDPRANHLSAKNRLKEDETKDGNGETQLFSSIPNSASEAKEMLTESSEDCGNLRSILKRKDTNEDSKPRKRVRFDVSCEHGGEEESGYIAMDASSVNPPVSVIETLPEKGASHVPDYLLNPSKYTCYSFDSSRKVDEKANTEAYMDILKLVKVSKAKEAESQSELGTSSVNITRTPTFIPKKKEIRVTAVDNRNPGKGNHEDGIQGSFLQTTVSLMAQPDATEDGESEMNAAAAAANKSVCFQKPCRQYRTKLRSDDSDS